MLEVIKKIMEAAEKLGTVTEFSAGEWSNAGEYHVDMTGRTYEGMDFQMRVMLMPPKAESKEQG